MHIYAAYNQQEQSQQTYIKVGSVIFLVIMTIPSFFLLKRVTQPTIISPVTAHAAENPPPRTLLLKKKDPEQFKAVVTNALDDSLPEYSIVVDDFLTNFHGEMGEQIPYTAASVN